MNVWSILRSHLGHVALPLEDSRFFVGGILISAGILAIGTGFMIRRAKQKSLKERSGRRLATKVVGVGLLLVTSGLFMMPTANPKGAWRATALATETACESAVNNFKTEYGVLPQAPAVFKTDSPEGVRLLSVLLGLATENDLQNPRAIKFLSVREGKNGKNGLIYSADGKSVTGLFDPWGNPFTLVMDTTGSGMLVVECGKICKELRGRNVAAWSTGPDRKAGTTDDVTTW